MAYYRSGDGKQGEYELEGYWMDRENALLVKETARGRYHRAVEAAGLVTFQEAATLIQRGGKPVSRMAIYNWAKEGKIRWEKVHPRPELEAVKVIRLSELRKFAERYGFECRPVPRGFFPPKER
ncbi:MAG: hypothetical protein HYV19_08030 [Gemmatimonadetes bacterium]|nr:hypothetical protein [Gemmatimonadota bacterium]